MLNHFSISFFFGPGSKDLGTVFFLSFRQFLFTITFGKEEAVKTICDE